MTHRFKKTRNFEKTRMLNEIEAELDIYHDVYSKDYLKEQQEEDSLDGLFSA